MKMRLLAFVLLIGVLCSAAVYAEEKVYTENGFLFSIVQSADSGEEISRIVGYEGTCPSHLVIPETLGGRPVNDIGERSFANRSEIQSVTLSAALVRVEKYAFENCSSLKKVDFPPSAKIFFGYAAFGNCDALEEVELPYGAARLGDYCFTGCDNLRRVTLPETLIAASWKSFAECPKLEWKEYGGVKYLGNEENPYFYAMTAVSTEIERVEIHKDCKVLAVRLFENCQLLEEAILPEGLLSIQLDAFAACFSLKELKIPDSVRYLAAFFYPSTRPVTEWAFSDNVKSFQSQGLSGENIGYATYEGGWYLGVEGNPYHILIKSSPDKNGCLKLHKDTKVVAGGAIENDELRTLILPEGLETIGDYAIYSGNLESVQVPKSLKCVGEGNKALEERHAIGSYDVGDQHYNGCYCGKILRNPVDHSSPEGATCVKKGACKDCGAIVGDLDPDRHGKLQMVNAKEASCSETGYTGDQICADCHAVLAAGKILSVIEHRDADGQYESDEGGHFYSCSCGATFSKEIHSFGEFETVVTEDSKKVQRRKCAVCAYSEERELTVPSSAAGTTASSTASSAASSTASAAPSSSETVREQGGFPWWIAVVLLVAGGAAGAGIYWAKKKGIRFGRIQK